MSQSGLQVRGLWILTLARGGDLENWVQNQWRCIKTSEKYVSPAWFRQTCAAGGGFGQETPALSSELLAEMYQQETCCRPWELLKSFWRVKIYIWRVQAFLAACVVSRQSFPALGVLLVISFLRATWQEAAYDASPPVEDKQGRLWFSTHL